MNAIQKITITTAVATAFVAAITLSAKEPGISAKAEANVVKQESTATTPADEASNGMACKMGQNGMKGHNMMHGGMHMQMHGNAEAAGTSEDTKAAGCKSMQVKEQSTHCGAGAKKAVKSCCG